MTTKDTTENLTDAEKTDETLETSESDEEPIHEEKRRKEKEKEEEDVVEERFYTIPLRRAWISPRKKRAPRAIRILKEFIQKHMKIETQRFDEEEPEVLLISNEVNEKIWRRGIEKPPPRIRVRAVKNKDGVVTVHLAEGD